MRRSFPLQDFVTRNVAKKMAGVDLNLHKIGKIYGKFVILCIGEKSKQSSNQY